MCRPKDLMVLRLPSWLVVFAERVAREGKGADHVRTHPCEPESVFECVEKPDFPISDYITLLTTGLKVAEDTWAAAAYLWLKLKKRIRQGRCKGSLNPYTVHRILLTCVVLADKLLNDQAASNPTYAGVGQITLTELYEMEAYVWKALDFNVLVGPRDIRRVRELLSPPPPMPEAAPVLPPPATAAAAAAAAAVTFSPVDSPVASPQKGEAQFVALSSAACCAGVGGACGDAVPTLCPTSSRRSLCSSNSNGSGGRLLPPIDGARGYPAW
eukprot:Rhum_TRINITY_DN14328_c17_g1::Rhum_TRINITY_DN14328_c17_g1_i1::g.83266::m.83266